MRFLFGVLILWGFVAVLVSMERISGQVLLGAAWITLLLLRRSRDDVAVQKRLNRMRRWWGRQKLSFKFGQQRSFSSRRGKDEYAIASEGLTEDQIRAWVSEEMENEMAQYGFAVNYRFLTEPEEIEDRAKKLARFYTKGARIFFFVKVEWLPEQLRQSFMEGAIKGLIGKMSIRYGEVLAQEIAKDSLDTPEDSCVFYPQVIKEQWMNVDFDHSFSPETVIRKIARHEARHCAQFQALRSKGGSELVERVIQHKMSSTYGEDVLEYDAYRCQLGEERSIDEFLKEAMIEVD